MSKRCYYEILGVQRTVNDDELKSAFRKLALKWHPDRNRGDASSEARFKEINEAYEILKDPEKRTAYDRFGHAAFEQAGLGGAPGFGADGPYSARPAYDMVGVADGRDPRTGLPVVSLYGDGEASLTPTAGPPMRPTSNRYAACII